MDPWWPCRGSTSIPQTPASTDAAPSEPTYTNDLQGKSGKILRLLMNLKPEIDQYIKFRYRFRSVVDGRRFVCFLAHRYS